MVNLSKRAIDPEIMDDFSLPDTEVVPVLKGLEKLNALFGGHKSLIKALVSISKTKPFPTMHILKFYT